MPWDALDGQRVRERAMGTGDDDARSPPTVRRL